MRALTNEGLGFVVTSNAIKGLLLDRTVMWAGLDGRWSRTTSAKAPNLPQSTGYLVTRAYPETVAGEDIMIGGDVVVKAQGVQISPPSDLSRVRDTLKLAPGQDITVTVLRDGKMMDLPAVARLSAPR